MPYRGILFVLLMVCTVQYGLAQVTPPDQPPVEPEQQLQPAPNAGALNISTFTINRIRVEGITDQSTQDFVIRTSGLEEGQQVQIPGDQALAQAIRSIYQIGMFSDVKIKRDEGNGDLLDLTIEVEAEPRLGAYQINGVTNRQQRNLRDEIELLAGQPVRDGDVSRSERAIQQYFEDEGYVNTEVTAQRRQLDDGRVDVHFYVEPGERATVHRIAFSGNEAFSDRQLRGQMSETKERRWWRFWSRESLDRTLFQEDLDNIIEFYNERGYFDAQVLSDSVYLVDDGLRIDIEVREGSQYRVRNIDWEGNTIFGDAALTEALGLQEGGVFDRPQMIRNIRGNQQSTDVSAMYRNQGHMMINVQPHVRVIPGDSVDITLDVREGEVFEIGDINIAGNDKTKDHVVRRELYTMPGSRFSQDAIQESIRRLMQLNYFSQESLAQGPGISIDEERNEVDLTYTVEEVGSDQLELSGTYGALGLVLQLQFSFNNFSMQNLFNTDAYRPLPSGDGQRLSVGIQTNGRYYQSYSLSFTEPWFRGNPTPLGGSVSYSRFTSIPRTAGFGGVRQLRSQQAGGLFEQFNSRVFMQQRLQWPDDRFQTSTGLSYRYYNHQDRNGQPLLPFTPLGVNQEIVLEQGISRNSLDNPMFPTRGARSELRVEVAPPVPGFLQYHKWRFNNDWNIPLANKITLNASANYGYIGSIAGDDIPFQRFTVGGTQFDYSRVNFGDDPIFLRGYPARAIGPRETRVNPNSDRLISENVGGRILNKYQAELRWLAVQSNQLQAAPYLFFDAANTWRDFDSFDPASLYRSAGVGARLFLPIVGMIEISYGYNLDQFQHRDTPGVMMPREWTFQFSLGQGGGGSR